jgi:hypothetical protein
MIPLWLNFGITEFLHISIYKTPLTVPSKKYGPVTSLAKSTHFTMFQDRELK